jgi:hypothetical protein
MSNREVAGLQALAKQHGGNLSVNPDTGLPEAGFLDSLLPTIAGAGLTYFSGGAINPMMAGALVGGITALDSKDLGKGLMAGFGAWGGAGLTEGLMGVGASQLGGAAAAQQTAAEQLANAGAGQGAYIPDDAIARAATPSNFDKLGAGAGQLFSNPGQTLQAIGGGSGYKAAGMLGAAAAPIIADEMVETTTEAPPQDRGKIRPYTYSRQQIPQDYQDQQGNMGSRERRYFNDAYTAGDPYSAAGGGLVALASGGYTNQNIFKPTTPLPENNMYGASRDAYDYLMGANPPSGGGQTRPYDPNYPINDIHIDDGANLNPPTKGGTGKYVFDPVTKQYKWVPDPIKPVDVAAPVFENPMQAGGGGGMDSESREAQRLEREKYFDNMTPEQREEHAANLRKGMDVLGNLMPGSWIPKAANAVQTFFKEQQLKDIYAKEAADKEAKRAQEESNNLLSMIQFTNEETPYTPPQADPAQQQQVEARESAARAAATSAAAATGSPFSSGTNVGFSGAQFSGSTPTAPGYTSSQFSGEGLNGVQVGPPAPSPSPAPSAPAPSDPGQGDGSGNEGRGGRDAGGGEGRNGPEGRGDPGGDRGGWGRGGGYAHGGIADLHQYNLGSYSDGGRLLKGPGDGVSDDIPATIGHGQPARLADGEFVIPARIVSEIGNGSTDAGARELYKMMDRIQAGRKKTVGKDQVAKNSKAVRHLPA